MRAFDSQWQPRISRLREFAHTFWSEKIIVIFFNLVLVSCIPNIPDVSDSIEEINKIDDKLDQIDIEIEELETELENKEQ